MSSKTDDQLDFICSSFSTIYFGHLNPILQPWQELAQQIKERCGENDSEVKQCFDAIWVRLAEHPAAKFPVSRAHQRRTREWSRQLGRVDFPPGFDANEDASAEPNYVFKTYDFSGTLVTLLEENRDPLGQGTTGLISWQGAVMLQAWADTFAEEHLEGENKCTMGGNNDPMGRNKKET